MGGKLVAAAWRQNRSRCRLGTRPYWIEKVQESTNDPIPSRDAKSEGRHNRQQEHGGEQECRHKRAICLCRRGQISQALRRATQRRYSTTLVHAAEPSILMLPVYLALTPAGIDH